MPRLMEARKKKRIKEGEKKRKSLIMRSLLCELLSVEENDAVGETTV